jgi:hypothetical protein
MKDDEIKKELLEQSMRRAMVNRNRHQSDIAFASGGMGDENQRFMNAQAIHANQSADRKAALDKLATAYFGEGSLDPFKAEKRAALEKAKNPLAEATYLLKDTDGTMVMVENGEKRPVAGYPFKEELVVTLERYERVVAELAAMRYENVQLKQKCNDLTNALSNARDAAADMARDKGHLEKRIGELVVEAEHYKARMKR